MGVCLLVSPDREEKVREVVLNACEIAVVTRLLEMKTCRSEFNECLVDVIRSLLCEASTVQQCS